MFSINDFPKNDEIISTSGIPATEKGEQTETSFNLIDQQTGSFPRDSGHPGPSLGEITHIQADLRTPYNPQAVTTMSSHQLINQYQLPAYQSTNGVMPSFQVNTQNRFSVIRSSHQVAANDHLSACAISTVPLNYMPSIQDETDQPEFPSYNVDYCSPESRQGMQFVDANVKGSGCQCCSHESSLMHPSHVPVFEVENYRYSVIMVPIKWNNTACQFEVNSTTPVPFVQNWEQDLTDGMDHPDDTDYSSDEDEYEETYDFRTVVDRTVARVKLRCHERRKRYP